MTRSTICESIFLHSPTIPLSNSSFLSFIFSQSSRFGCCADERLLTSKLSSPVFETLSSSSPLNTLTLLHWINYSTSILLLQPFLWTRYYLATRSNLVLDLLRFGLTAIVTNRAARLAVLKDVSVGKRTPNDCVFALPGFCYIVLFITFTTKRRLRIGKILFPGRQKPKAALVLHLGSSPQTISSTRSSILLGRCFLNMHSEKSTLLRTSTCTADSPPPKFSSSSMVFDDLRPILDSELRSTMTSANLKSCELDPPSHPSSLLKC